MKNSEKIAKADDSPLTPLELAKKFSEALKEKNVSIVEGYLADGLQFYNERNEKCTTSKKEYLNHLDWVLKDLARTKTYLYRNVGYDNVTGSVGIRIQRDWTDAEPEYVGLTCSNGLITIIRIMEEPDEFIISAEANDFYQGHGTHCDAIMDSKVFHEEYFPKILWNEPQTTHALCKVTLYDYVNQPANVFTLDWGDGDVKIRAMMVSIGGQNSFEAIYPITKGYPFEVKITDVIEWDNRIEAIIKCSIDDYDIAFYATDYYLNRNRYIVGGKMTVLLSAVATEAHAPDEGFDFHGQEAIDFQSKLGKQPDYDEDGNVKPLHISMANMLAYFPEDSSPDIASFQAPATKVSYCSLYDIQFVKCNIKISTSIFSETDMTIPLYFRHEFIPNVHEKTPVGGELWMTGRIDEQEVFGYGWNSVKEKM